MTQMLPFAGLRMPSNLMSLRSMVCCTKLCEDEAFDFKCETESLCPYLTAGIHAPVLPPNPRKACFSPHEYPGRIAMKFGSRNVMRLSAISYAFWTASYLLPDSRVFLGLSCAWVGLSAATLWTAHGSYMAACAQKMSKDTGKVCLLSS